MRLVPQSLTRTLGRAVLQTKKDSPHIFFALGIAGVIGSTVLACKATLKLEDTVDEIKSDFNDVKKLHSPENVEIIQAKFTREDYYKDLGHVYVRSFVTVSKLYGPAVLIGVASIASLTGSHVQLARRNTALTVTLAAVSQAFDDYRERVREELGVDKELEISRAIRTETIEEDGKKKLVKTADPNKWSPYAKIFDESNPNYEKNAEFNRNFLQLQQNYMNHRLQAYGHVFLNEVYDALGFERTTPGAVVGWVLGNEGDNYIDFGLFEPKSARFINGEEMSIILDFNVDGVVYDKIGPRQIMQQRHRRQ